jgi:hypothetical protein
MIVGIETKMMTGTKLMRCKCAALCPMLIRVTSGYVNELVPSQIVSLVEERPNGRVEIEIAVTM